MRNVGLGVNLAYRSSSVQPHLAKMVVAAGQGGCRSTRPGMFCLCSNALRPRLGNAVDYGNWPNQGWISAESYSRFSSAAKCLPPAYAALMFSQLALP